MNHAPRFRAQVPYKRADVESKEMHRYRCINIYRLVNSFFVLSLFLCLWSSVIILVATASPIECLPRKESRAFDHNRVAVSRRKRETRALAESIAPYRRDDA